LGSFFVGNFYGPPYENIMGFGWNGEKGNGKFIPFKGLKFLI